MLNLVVLFLEEILTLLNLVVLFLEEILTSLNQYAILISAVATIVVAGATLFYVIQNRKLIKRSRLSNKPNINLELSNDLTLLINSIGKTLAKNVLLKTHITVKKKSEYIVNDNIEDFSLNYLQEKENVNVRQFREKITSLLVKRGLLVHKSKTIQEPFDNPTTGEPEIEYVEYPYLEMKNNLSFQTEMDIIIQYESEVGDMFEQKYKYNVFFHPRTPSPPDEEYDTDDRIKTHVISNKGKWKDNLNSKR